VFARVRAGGPARLRLVGDGPERTSAVAELDRLGLAADVELVGEPDDLPAVLADADLFLLPSETESFGLAALEAMACEVPVVASRVGGLPEIIDDGVTGFVCPPDDLELMAERGVRLLTDRALRESVTRQAVSLVRSRYCAGAIVPLYEAAYRQVLASVAR
jgi:glycosyltransferase involved in cell wall biosynthesis